MEQPCRPALTSHSARSPLSPPPGDSFAEHNGFLLSLGIFGVIASSRALRFVCFVTVCVLVAVQAAPEQRRSSFQRIVREQQQRGGHGVPGWTVKRPSPHFGTQTLNRLILMTNQPDEGLSTAVLRSHTVNPDLGQKTAVRWCLFVF